MTKLSHRWVRHRVVDAVGSDKSGAYPFSLWWAALAAAEETLQGAPLAAAWLKLFANHLSASDTYWLRWRHDMAESAEMRRSYSGLYGRMFSRALLTHHLKLTNFVPLQRNGIQIPGSVHVKRIKNGDIPDWIAWDGNNSRFVLCEAKGSLTGSDFFGAAQPKCIQDGKRQFSRVATFDGATEIHPSEWVAACRWATDERKSLPWTILWDPPVNDPPFSAADMRRHRNAISRAWLASLAPGFGFRTPEELAAKERASIALELKASPAGDPAFSTWSEPFEDNALYGLDEVAAGDLRDDLRESSVYQDNEGLLLPPERSAKPHVGKYLTAAITQFGIRPVRSKVDLEALKRDQQRAREGEQAAMVVGIPLGIELEGEIDTEVWAGEPGIASSGRLAVFDLRQVEFNPVDSANMPNS